MKKDPKIYLEHILDAVERIEEYVEGMSEEEFMEETQIQDAVIRRFEIIGEATKNIPDDFKKGYPDILWKKMAGMRDVLIHGYTDVDIKLVWDTIKLRLPDLKERIEELLSNN